ncbi:Maltose/maltodextrin ABC transporter, substrate binding periplasmic protein MalE [Labilithrix luteola]|uniref:Maltose/maltodextrin ABC transporter, substrate binding periplasmic protein MalE n=1 Tax=Labilithrix luteola TaxID=1391654 RepID=A0A0K1PQX4_9BACT|nr:extracellular solute-binding protein [Labilithrix luteola]AKU95933.1 Maltose/maltodextrin ABC transporter, substrate binding periplasmic protein MalE [Labilithrix luteola]
MRRFQALAVALIALLIGVLPGCSEPAPGIVLWHPYRGAEQKALETIAKRFADEKHVEVTVLAVPNEAYAAKLEAAIPRGNGPDVFVSPHERLGSYLSNALVSPAGDAFPDEDVARYEPVTVEAVTDRSVRYAVPLASKCLALYIDTRKLPKAPSTLEELEAAKGKLGPGVFPLAYEAQSAYFHAPLLHAFGGRLFDGTTFAMVGPKAEAAAEKARALTTSGVIPEEPSGDLVKQLFLSGKAAAVISGPWLAGELAGVPYEVVPLPRIGSEGPMRPYLTVDGAFLTPQGSSRTEARALARYLGDDASARERADTGKQIVASRSYWTSERHGEGRALLEAFHAASADAIPMPTSLAMRATWVPAEQALRKVLRGMLPPRRPSRRRKPATSTSCGLPRRLPRLRLSSRCSDWRSWRAPHTR